MTGLAGMVAYNLLLSIFPLALVALFVAGRVLRSSEVELSVLNDLKRVFPTATTNQQYLHHALIVLETVLTIIAGQAGVSVRSASMLDTWPALVEVTQSVFVPRYNGSYRLCSANSGFTVSARKRVAKRRGVWSERS